MADCCAIPATVIAAPARRQAQNAILLGFIKEFPPVQVVA
jgi:hypothetical protein